MTAQKPEGPSSQVQADLQSATVALHKVAYEEGKRLVDDQIAELDAMRQRAMQLLAFVGSATAFLVGSILNVTVNISVAVRVAATVTACISLASIVLACVILLALVDRDKVVDGSKTSLKLWLPRRRAWNFRLDPTVLVDGWIEPAVGKPMNESDFYRSLAHQYSGMANENDDALSTVRTCYWIFVALTSLQVTLWATLAWFVR